MPAPRIAPAPYQPDVAVPPGETIRDMLRDMGMTQAELAVRMNRPANKVNEIIQGKRQITVETALELELTLGLPANFWINLEKNYQLAKARIAEESRLAEETVALKKFPVREMCKLGWIQRLSDIRLQVRELLGFFGIARFAQLQELESIAPAWRKAQKKQPCSYALAAWLRKGVLKASKVETDRFDAALLKKSLPKIKAILLQDDFEHDLVAAFAKTGIAVVFVPHLPKSYVNGAAYWLHEKAVIQLSLRNAWADIILFSLFHEVGHILLHGKTDKAFLDEKFREGDFATDDPKKEREANDFAANTLIPPQEYAKFLSCDFRRPGVVKAFAQRIGVMPGVVVGRLHHDGKLHHSQLLDIRAKMEWSEGECC